MSGISRVCSHPQALGQCRNWLEENLPEVPLVDVASTALAAQMAAEDESVAVIASEAAGNLYGLQVAKQKIEDHPNNYTRFLVVGRSMPKPTGKDKTSIMFSIKDEAGILYRMLEPFSSRNINLSKIESRPLKRKAWEYIFFLDMEGHIEESIVSEAVEDLKQYCQFIKVLGSFPRGR
jgi:chorismate mutase/prephenate dehydratase